ncbi:SPOR domain-containing protein [Candidatus Omnitrophota bacterium]
MKSQFQLELFQSQQYQAERAKGHSQRGTFFGFLRAHEKAISFVIVFLIVSLISFSLGVAKGRRSAAVVKNEERLINRAKLTQPKQQEIQKAEVVQPAEKTKEKEVVAKYTIQVASFKTNTYAQKEAGRLQQKGLEVSVLPKGDFVVVYVGNFSERQDAEAAQSKLRKTYQDCIIRRL